MKKSKSILNQLEMYQAQIEQYQNRIDQGFNLSSTDHKKLFDKVDIIEKAVLGIQFNQQNQEKILEKLEVLAEQGNKRLDALEKRQEKNDHLWTSIKEWVKWGILIIGGAGALIIILWKLGIF